jgi:hypothetical protein
MSSPAQNVSLAPRSTKTRHSRSARSSRTGAQVQRRLAVQGGVDLGAVQGHGRVRARPFEDQLRGSTQAVVHLLQHALRPYQRHGRPSRASAAAWDPARWDSSPTTSHARARRARERHPALPARRFGLRGRGAMVRAGPSRVARPGLEPGTPRFSGAPGGFVVVRAGRTLPCKRVCSGSRSSSAISGRLGGFC